ncbi:MAG: hypothetical protein RIM23_29395 [Coleofasciculus sp. G3-WIS-01]|uniref:interleukin-like EMT inducer domain-containing protein n=1 Tax=Coleofasciculus sp. G3-WIS-01 TaxID=3069528 RepID=UPI0032F16410
MNTTNVNASRNGVTTTVKVSSAGYDHGNCNMAKVTCNGALIPLAGGYQRGLNVVVFDQSNGRQLQSQSFDLYADPANADAFAHWIDTLTPRSGGCDRG